MLSPADGPTGGTENPQDRADQDQDSTYGRQEAHAHEQPDDQQDQSDNNHHDSIRRVVFYELSPRTPADTAYAATEEN
ncbi:hypothetical protein ABII15_06430 [Streptomyces sp. HUAS MG91]|uniref:Uncharacterized protein n=1 Tax=Streptomyces tabacisoli TaxID=3156398 RepID=A0AAU8J613_9ACTN